MVRLVSLFIFLTVDKFKKHIKINNAMIYFPTSFFGVSSEALSQHSFVPTEKVK